MKKSNLDCSSRTLYRKGLAAFFIVVLTGLILACGTALYLPTESQGTSSVSLEDLQDGRDMYINKCGSCHALVVPEKYSSNDWEQWLLKMEPKAKITPLEKEQILKYLTKGKK